MADTVESLQGQLDALRKHRASATRTVEYTSGSGQTERVTFRDDAEMAAAISDMERRLAALLNPTAPKVIYFRTSKGL